MPLTTETFDLEAEYDALIEQIDDLEAEAEEYDEETPHYAQAVGARDELVRRRTGLERFAAAFPDAESVTLAELNPAEYAALEKHLPDDYGQQEYRTVMTAVATVEAPYVPDDDPSVGAIKQVVNDDVPPYFTRWAASKADELMETDEVEENPFSQTSTTDTEGGE